MEEKWKSHTSLCALCYRSGSARGRTVKSHSRPCIVIFNLCKILCLTLAEVALEGRFHIWRSSALSGVMIGLILINDGKPDCLKQCWIWCHKILNRRWRMGCDGFNLSLCWVPSQGRAPMLVWRWESLEAKGSCPSLSYMWCSSCLLIVQAFRGVASTLSCPKAADINRRDFLFILLLVGYEPNSSGIFSSFAERESCNMFLADEVFSQRIGQTMAL